MKYLLILAFVIAPLVFDAQSDAVAQDSGSAEIVGGQIVPSSRVSADSPEGIAALKNGTGRVVTTTHTVPADSPEGIAALKNGTGKLVTAAPAAGPKIGENKDPELARYDQAIADALAQEAAMEALLKSRQSDLEAAKKIAAVVPGATVQPAGDAAVVKTAQAVAPIVNAVQSMGVPPDSCGADASINDLIKKKDAWVGKRVSLGQACSNLYGYVCETRAHTKRQKEVSRDYNAREIEAIVEAMPDGKNKDAARKALKQYKESKNLDVAFEDDPGELVPPPKGQKRERRINAKPGLLKGDALAAFKESGKKLKESGKLNADVFKSILDKEGADAENILIQEKKNLTRRLEEMQASVEEAFGAYQGDKEQRSRDHAFIGAAFSRMKQAVDDAQLDLVKGAASCVKDQRNTLIDRGPNGKMSITVCPATLLSSKPEIAGAISRALGHSIDSCALDAMGVGAKPAVSLGALFEPLRNCVGMKVTPEPNRRNGETKESIARVLFPPTEANQLLNPRPSFEKDLRTSVKRFETRINEGLPHCPAPVTAGLLKKSSFPQRDQSNDAVAQFFGTEALAKDLSADSWIRKNLMPKSSLRPSEFAREALASYCDAEWTPESSHPPVDLLLNRVVAQDSQFRKLVCNDGASVEKNSQEMGKGYFEAATSTNNTVSDRVLKLSKNVKGCEGEVYKGFADYLREFDRKDTALYKQFEVDAKKGPFPSNGAINLAAGAKPGAASFAPAKKSDGAPGSVSLAAPASDEALGGSSGMGGRMNVPGGESFGGRQVADFARPGASSEWYRGLEQALSQSKDDCHREFAKNGQGGVPFDQNFLAQQCQGHGNFIDVDMWGAPRMQKVGDASYQVGCTARCMCGEKQCYFPEPVSREQMVADAGIPRKFNPGNVLEDANHFLYRKEDQGRYGIAAKRCFLNTDAPSETRADVRDACQKQSGKGVVKVTGKPVDLVGLTSGAALTFGCDYRCSCGSEAECRVVVHPPDPNSVKMAGAAQLAEAGKPRPALAPGADVVMAQEGRSRPGSAGLAAANLDDVPRGAPPRQMPTGGAPVPTPEAPQARPVIIPVEGLALVAAQAVADPGPESRQRYKAREFTFHEAQRRCADGLIKDWEKELAKLHPGESIKDLEERIDDGPTPLMPAIHNYYCAKDGKANEEKFLKPIGKEGLDIAGVSQSYEFRYGCRYDCNACDPSKMDSKALEDWIDAASLLPSVAVSGKAGKSPADYRPPSCALVRLDEQKPASKQVFPQDTPEQKEKARAADWKYMLGARAEKYCESTASRYYGQYGDGLVSVASVCEANSDLKNVKFIDKSTEHIYFTKLKGEISGARLPFACEYDVPCKHVVDGKEVSYGENLRPVKARAVALSLAGPGDYSDLEARITAKRKPQELQEQEANVSVAQPKEQPAQPKGAALEQKMADVAEAESRAIALETQPAKPRENTPPSMPVVPPHAPVDLREGEAYQKWLRDTFSPEFVAQTKKECAEHLSQVEHAFLNSEKDKEERTIVQDWVQPKEWARGAAMCNAEHDTFDVYPSPNDPKDQPLAFLLKKAPNDQVYAFSCPIVCNCKDANSPGRYKCHLSPAGVDKNLLLVPWKPYMKLEPINPQEKQPAPKQPAAPPKAPPAPPVAPASAPLPFEKLSKQFKEHASQACVDHLKHMDGRNTYYQRVQAWVPGAEWSKGTAVCGPARNTFKVYPNPRDAKDRALTFVDRKGTDGFTYTFSCPLYCDCAGNAKPGGYQCGVDGDGVNDVRLVGTKVTASGASVTVAPAVEPPPAYVNPGALPPGVAAKLPKWNPNVQIAAPAAPAPAPVAAEAPKHAPAVVAAASASREQIEAEIALVAKDYVSEREPGKKLKKGQQLADDFLTPRKQEEAARRLVESNSLEKPYQACEVIKKASDDSGFDRTRNSEGLTLKEENQHFYQVSYVAQPNCTPDGKALGVSKFVLKVDGPLRAKDSCPLTLSSDKDKEAEYASSHPTVFSHGVSAKLVDQKKAACDGSDASRGFEYSVRLTTGTCNYHCDCASDFCSLK